MAISPSVASLSTGKISRGISGEAVLHLRRHGVEVASPQFGHQAQRLGMAHAGIGGVSRAGLSAGAPDVGVGSTSPPRQDCKIGPWDEASTMQRHPIGSRHAASRGAFARPSHSSYVSSCTNGVPGAVAHRLRRPSERFARANPLKPDPVNTGGGIRCYRATAPRLPDNMRRGGAGCAEYRSNHFDCFGHGACAAGRRSGQPDGLHL